DLARAIHRDVMSPTTNTGVHGTTPRACARPSPAHRDVNLNLELHEVASHDRFSIEIGARLLPHLVGVGARQQVRANKSFDTARPCHLTGLSRRRMKTDQEVADLAGPIIRIKQ